MKKIYQLKSVLDITLWLSIAVLGLSVAAIIAGAFMPLDLNFTIRGTRVDRIDLPLGIVIAFSVTGYIFFMAALLKLQKLVTRFVNREFFSSVVVALLHKIGVNLMISAFLLHIPPYVYEIVGKNTLNIQFASVNPESFFFLIIMALFFITLSYIFDEAKNLREDNELTV